MSNADAPLGAAPGDAEDPTSPSTPAASPPVLSGFDAFLVTARNRRTAQPPHQPDMGPWADPDPDAIARLDPSRRPAARLLARRGGRHKSRNCFRAQITQVCRLVQDADGVAPSDRQPPETYPWHHLDADHAARYRQLIHARYSNVGTRNLMLVVVREVLRECRRAGLISAMRLDEVLEQLPTKSPARTSRGRRLTPDELARLLRVCQEDGEPRRATRDAAIIAVFACTGMRASELIDLNVCHWDGEDRSLFLALTKNGRPHTVFLPTAAVPYLQRWLEQRRPGSGPLFTMVIGDTTRRLTYPALYELLRTRADQASLRRFGSHDFRRTLATTLLRTHDISLVSRILGHADVASTGVYDLAGDDECRAAVETLPLPPSSEPAGNGSQCAEPDVQPDPSVEDGR